MNRAYPWLTTGLILKAAQAGACDDGIHRANLALMGVASAFPGYGTILDEDLTWLAEQPFATSEILKSLEDHPSIRVRRAVAYNHNTQIDTLRILVNDSSGAVRQAALDVIRSRSYVWGEL